MTLPIAAKHLRYFYWVFFSLLALNAKASTPIIIHMEGDILQMAEEHARIASENAKALEKFQILETRKTIFKQNSFINTFRKRFMQMHLPNEYEKSFSFFDFIWGWNKNQYLDYMSSEEQALLAGNWNKLFWNTSVIWKFDNASVFHGNMLESPLGSTWSNSLAILHAIPSTGLAYVGISSLGFHHFGFSGFNESGISLSTHSFPTRDSTSKGTLSSIIAAEVLRNARSISDAVSIISSFPRIAGTSYVLSQGIHRATIETNAYEISIRKATGPFFYQTDLPETPSFLTTPGNLALVSQRKKLEKYKSLSNRNILGSPKELFKILDEVSSPATVASSVLDPHQKRIFIKPSPYSPEYYEIRFQDLRSRERPVILTKSISELDVLTPATVSETEQTKIHHMMLEDNPELIKTLAQSVEKNAKDDNLLKLFFWGAIFFDNSQQLKALSLKIIYELLTPEQLKTHSLWIALLMDHYQERSYALRFYAKHYDLSKGYTHTLSELGLKKTIWASDLIPDWVHLDLVPKSHFVTDYFSSFLE